MIKNLVEYCQWVLPLQVVFFVLGPQHKYMGTDLIDVLDI